MTSFSRFFPALVASFLILLEATGCDRGSDTRRDNPAQPGNGGREEPIKPPTSPDSIQRPGVGGGDYDFSKELTDATWRYIGNGIELKYSTPGVLFKTSKTFSSKSVQIINLDDSGRIDILLGQIGTDSIVDHPSLKINDQEVELSQMKMMKTTSQSIWYHLKTAEGIDNILVTPSN